MATLDLAGIITRVCSDLRGKFASISALDNKQDTLVSGSNIKTINSRSLLGGGNLEVLTADTVKTLKASSTHIASDKGYNQRMWFTSADGTKWVPINTSTSTNATTARTLNTRPIDPFGPIVYYSILSGYVSAENPLQTSYMWYKAEPTIGYSYVINMTNRLPVYLRCTPNADGSATMVDVVQALPSASDGYIYIFLGTAMSGTSFELQLNHPVYYHDGTGIRLWTGEPISN